MLSKRTSLQRTRPVETSCGFRQRLVCRDGRTDCFFHLNIIETGNDLDALLRSLAPLHVHVCYRYNVSTLCDENHQYDSVTHAAVHQKGQEAVLTSYIPCQRASQPSASSFSLVLTFSLPLPLPPFYTCYTHPTAALVPSLSPSPQDGRPCFRRWGRE